MNAICYLYLYRSYAAFVVILYLIICKIVKLIRQRNK